MKSLFEVVGRKTAVFTFGRMNPPTLGHEKLIKKVLEVASKNNAKPFIFISNTKDSKKNPLTTEQKIKYLRLSIPDAEKHIYTDSSIKTPFDALKTVEKMGFTDVIFVGGSDQVNDLYPSLKRYVKHPDKSKSFELESFTVVSAGERIQDGTGVDAASSTKLRLAASKNDFSEFKKTVPSKLSEKFAKEMFDAIRSSMKIESIVEEVQKLKNTLNIPRSSMPQIKKDFIPDFIKSLKNKGVGVSKRDVLVDALRPTQNEINMDKVKEKYKKLKNGKDVKPFIISSDNYILDGHHQLFALKSLDSRMQVPCYVVNVKMTDLLKYAHSFPKTTYKSISD